MTTWTVATCHPIPVAILDDLRQHLHCGTQVRVLLRLPGPVFTIDAALLASRQKGIHAEIIQRLDELNAVADGRPTTTTSAPARHWLAKSQTHRVMPYPSSLAEAVTQHRDRPRGGQPYEPVVRQSSA